MGRVSTVVMLGIVVSSFVFVSMFLYQGGSVTGWQLTDFDFGDQNQIDPGVLEESGTGEERGGEDSVSSYDDEERSVREREQRISASEKNLFLERFGVESGLDAAEVYLAPVIVNAKTLEMSQECRNRIVEYYSCSSPVTSQCLYAGAGEVLAGNADGIAAKGYTEILCIRKEGEGVDVTCPAVFRERVACRVREVDAVTSVTQLSPGETGFELIETQLLDENSKLVALLTVIENENGDLERLDVVFENAALI